MNDGSLQDILTAADGKLNPYQACLYTHLVLACFEAEDGICNETTRELAAACQMSTGQVVKVRHELAVMGFIDVKSGAGNQAGAVRLCSPHERKASSVHHMNASVSPDEHKPDSVHGMNTNDEQRSPHEQEADSVHHMNANPSHERAVNSSLGSLGSSQDKDLKAKDKNNNTPLTPQTEKGGAGGGVDTNLPRVADLYEQVTGRTINPIIADELKDDAANYPLERIEEAARLTLLAGKTSWRYTQGIMKNNGKPRASPQQAIENTKTTPRETSTFDAGAHTRQLAAEGKNDPSWVPPLRTRPQKASAP